MRSLLVLSLLTAALFAAEPAGPTPAGNPGAPSAPPASPAAKESQWRITVDAPATDGSKSVSATLLADAPIPSGFDKVTPKLVLRYRAGRTSAFVVFDTFLGSGLLDVVVGFGNQPAQEQKWRISADGRSAIISGDALAFIEHLKQVESFSVHFAPRKATPLTVSFTPLETELVIKALLSAGVKYGS